MKSYYIHLIRNGLTKANLDGRYIGHIDEPLSEQGIKQIQQMKTDFDYPKADAVFTSPLKRCVETAKLIYPSANPIEINDLIEYNFGEFEGKTADELKNHPVFPDWIKGKKDVAPPFGESNEAFANRIGSYFLKMVDGLIKTGTTDCAVITHGGVIMALMSFFALPEAPMHEWMSPGGCGFTLRVTPSVWSRGHKAEAIAQIPKIPGEEDYSMYGMNDYEDPFENFDVNDYI